MISSRELSSMRLLTSVLSAAAALSFLALPSLAAPYEEGTVLVRLRALSVLPTVDATVNIGGKLSISNSVIPEVDVTYFFTPHWSVEVIAGTTKHAIYYNQTTKLANSPGRTAADRDGAVPFRPGRSLPALCRRGPEFHRVL